MSSTLEACRLRCVHRQIPSRILNTYQQTNEKLRTAPKPPLTGSLNKPKLASSSQNLELDVDLQAHAKRMAKEGKLGPTTMLNLLHFYDRPDAKSEYYKYGQSVCFSIIFRRTDIVAGQGFATVAGKRGGNAKMYIPIASLSRIKAHLDRSASGMSYRQQRTTQGKADSRTSGGMVHIAIRSAVCPY